MRRAAAAAVALVALTQVVAACSTSSEAACPPAAIAFVGPLSGPTAALGRPIRNAVALAVADHNAEAECPVGLVELDTQGDLQQAGPVASQVVDLPDVVGVIGPTLSGETGVALPAFEAAGLVAVTPSATNAELGTRGWRSFHRVVTSDATQGPAVARYLTSLGLDRVALVDDGSLYGDGIADLVASALPALGGSVTSRRTIDPTSRDHTPAIDEVVASGAEAVFFGGTDTVAATLVRQLREAGSTAVFSAPDAVFTEVFLAAAGPAAEGAVLTCPCAPAATGERPAIRLFAARYLDTYGSSPGPFGAEAYDATTLLLDAIGEAGLDRAAALAAVEAADVEGVTGTISFDEAGEVTEGPVYLYRVDGGRFVPAGEVVGEAVLPPGGR